MVMALKRFELRDCMDQGLIRRIPPSEEKATGSISAADRWLDEAEKGIYSEAYGSSVIASYMAMFHSSRAILLRDGYREKSHYCIARYLEEKYAKKGLIEKKWIDLLDHSRELRHESQYDVSFFATREDAESAAQSAKIFVERIKALIKVT
jgi:uncharacterized protein (UPF0332 family)